MNIIWSKDSLNLSGLWTGRLQPVLYVWALSLGFKQATFAQVYGLNVLKYNLCFTHPYICPTSTKYYDTMLFALCRYYNNNSRKEGTQFDYVQVITSVFNTYINNQFCYLYKCMSGSPCNTMDSSKRSSLHEGSLSAGQQFCSQV